ncbi:MAG: oxygen-independent coproporphyrinogen III oxidase [Alteromonas sp.]|jgi:oxygen-independent coproporphyrinogen-3 oxidase|uniref:oxygen-independent coproporphyrinogen III oxidase n=1 Tax=Alteromonas sp. RW2A1 TaxID=1917158 RepID=UPI0009036EAC|nr:oxygen-independent coproporphyrinogen III oxidase [Alteromonas sp. RW2A1]APE06192.1 oxygen-independent coproporphyrinogen III oxidase [Alteromonas sp. RW2A1]MAI64559.1 oxygen-independent coproporphyrinogen III oxidase [Alteromonas sp.]
MTVKQVSQARTTTIEKYAKHAPRYTSYPTALNFSPVNNDILSIANKATKADSISLYIHIPFCKTLCYYCGCNKIVTRHNSKADEYLAYIEKEIVAKSNLYKDKMAVSLHLGGGSPSFLSVEQQTTLMALLKKYISFDEDAEMSIELDPRNVDLHYLNTLKDLGYNRLSFGLQDTDFQVQQTINRVQSTLHISDLVFEARNLGFNSINLDLIYGLPHQSIHTFRTTIAATKAISPDRISLFSYAHLPERFAAQRKFADDILPNAELKAELYDLAVKEFKKIGYEMIGLDHFAKKSDNLALAKKAGKLHRNFQGYTLHGNTDLIGFGVSAISTIGNAFAQNPKQLKDYYTKVDNNEPVATIGLSLTSDDLIRRDVISSLMCNLSLDINNIERKHNIIFNDYFTSELNALHLLQKDGLVLHTEHGIVVPEHARIFIRAICATFDAYLDGHMEAHSNAQAKDNKTIPRFSKAI